MSRMVEGGMGLNRTTGSAIRGAGVAAVAIFLTLVGCRGGRAQGRGALETVRVHGRSLEGNLLGDSATREVAVYLPPRYAGGNVRYPVVYVLHGSAGSHRDWTDGAYQGMRLQASMDSLIGSGRVGEMIVVVPNLRNKYMGSFFTSSPVTGNWEGFITRDLVGYVDSAYRTIADPQQRGLAGHSMGGHGSIVLGMRYPTVFGSIYAMSPCCLDAEADLSADNPAWGVLLSMEQALPVEEIYRRHGFYPVALLELLTAYLPAPGRAPFLVDFPYEKRDGAVVRRAETYEKWRAAFPVRYVNDYRDNLRQLRGIFIDYGFGEQFAHIPSSVRAFSQELTELGVPHGVEVYVGDHRNRVRERFEAHALPFFTRVFQR